VGKEGRGGEEREKGCAYRKKRRNIYGQEWESSPEKMILAGAEAKSVD
jgi:hypothetical protein